MLPLLALLSTLQCDLVLLVEILFDVANGFLERHRLRIRVLRQKRDAQDPTDGVEPQDGSLDKHRCDTRQDVQIESLDWRIEVKSRSKTVSALTDGNWPIRGIEMTETTRNALIM